MSTYWDRIEPHTRTTELEEGLQARIADPLWMLARQWQLGELRGEDAASPVHVCFEVVQARLRSFRNDALVGAAPEPLRGGLPLEARVEAESVADGPSAIQLAAEAGLALLRRLSRASLDDVAAELRRRFPLVIPPGASLGLPERETRHLALLARRGLDGRAVAAERPADLLRLAAEPNRPAFRTVIDHWRAESAARFVRPGVSGDTWADERLEYAFSIAASPGDDDVVLAADEYPGGQLDWFAFDVAPGQSHELGPGGVERRAVEAIPVPLAYPGMPASRWWEREEGSVYFGGIEAGPADLGRLAVAEFATVYADDWFLVPVRASFGSLVRVRDVDVIDCFGGVHRLRSAAVLDAAPRRWAFFELTGDPSVEKGAAPWLCLIPSLASCQDSRPVEEVTFVRDEAANLGWAIEHTIEAPTGTPLSRRLHTTLAAAPAAPAAALDDEAPWRYRLETEQPPPFWIPLAPERIAASSAEVRLRRARMLAWDDLPAGVAGPLGRILDPSRPLRLFEEEIPNAGIQVSRHWQLARGADGGRYLWMARRKRPGRGERGSHLSYDVLER